MKKYILTSVLFLAISALGFTQSYTASSANSSGDYSIKDVIFSGISNTGTNKSSYTNYTSQVSTVNAGSLYTLSVKVGKKKKQNLTVWIDWNHDFDFDDAGEVYILTSSGNHTETYSVDITVPSGAELATTRMRVTMIENKIPTSTGSQGKKGEVEDYSVTVLAELPPVPLPDNREDLMYYVADSGNELFIIDVTTGSCSSIGGTNVSNIEAIANWPAHFENELYATNEGDFGSLNTTTGAFTLIGEVDGGETANGSIGAQSLDDVDGLAFDGRTGILWASNRRDGTGNYDLLFQIDVTTGMYIANAFGNGIDYIVIDGVGVNDDVDDISISPINGEMYVVNNQGHNTTDQILNINKSTGEVLVMTLFTPTGSISDVEGCDFSYDGTFYVSSGIGNSLSTADTTDGSNVTINGSLCGGGDVEALASLVQEINTMEGNVWKDINEDGINNDGDIAISNIVIKLYFDSNNDGVLNSSDEYLNKVRTDDNGYWNFDFAAKGNLIAIIDETTLPPGYALTSSSIHIANFSSAGNTDSNNDFGAINNFDDCDSDGIPDFIEGNGDSDGDLVADKCDKDSDNDGILDADESTKDTDGDGIKDYLDLDSDNDGISDAIEANGGSAPEEYNNSGRIIGNVDIATGLLTDIYSAGVSSLINYDTDGDGAKDYVDLDSDNDGILDIVEASAHNVNNDVDHNGIIDAFSDSNNDGYNDSYVSNPLPIPNTDSRTGETLPNYRDIDSDDDSIDDSREGYSHDDYAVPSIIKDVDGDGILDFYDNNFGGTSIDPYDYDGDGAPDYLDLDSDNDGALDITEANDEIDENGIADFPPSGVDDNNNGLDDAFDRNCSGAANISVVASTKNEEYGNGLSYTNSSDIELVYDGEQQIIGIRFTGVNIEQGAKINTANIQFTADDDLVASTQNGDVILTIHGEDEDNAIDVSDRNSDISGRNQTSASATWSPAPWSIQSESGENQKTTDLVTIIQEIVNRPLWKSGNAIMIIIEGTSSSAYRHADWSNAAPVLNIETDGLQYNCGSDIPVNDFSSDTYNAFRNIGVVLPVALISFDAEKAGDNVDIKWTTASEINNDYFSVEKSDDNKNYQEIDLVKGAGNSNVTLDYSSIDFNMSQGVSYYRLKQVDYDGTTTYSNVVSIRNVAGEKTKLYPNPNNGQFVIDVNEAVEVSIYTVTGQIIYNNIFEQGSNNRVDLSNQKKGVYIITYYYSDEVVTSKLIIK